MGTRPSKSRFMGHDYAIQYHPVGSIHVGDAECFGNTDHNERTIQIEDGLPDAKTAEIVCHEMFHQMLSCIDLQVPEDLEERLATFFGLAITGHMRDNPKLWQWFAKAVRAKRKQKDG